MKSEYIPARLEIIDLSLADIVTESFGKSSANNTTEILGPALFRITRSGDLFDPFEKAER